MKKKETKTTVISDALRYSPALELEYKKALRGLVDNMLKDVAKGLVDAYRGNKQGFALDSAFNNIDDKLKGLEKKYRRIFETQGEEAAKKMIMRQLRYSRSAFKKVMSKLLPKETEIPSIAGSVIPRDVEEVIKASIMENVSLIKSIHQKYFEQVTGSIARSMQAGGSIKQLRDEILKYNGMTRRRADIIAYDQTRKTFQAINLRNMSKAGIKKAMWMHSGGGQTVREYHFRKWDGVSGKEDGRPNGLNGFVFDIDKPPVIQKAEGKQQEIRGYPAQLPNCYHKDTEVMTMDGFKKFWQLSEKDKILTLNPETKQLEYANILAFVKKWSDKILYIKGKSLDMAVDYDHRFFTYKKIEHKRGQYTLEPRFTVGFNNLSIKSNKFYSSSNWTGKHIDKIVIGKKEIDFNTFCKFMGYYLSEGNIDHKRKTTCVKIQQHKHLDKMYEDLKSMGFHKNKDALRIYDGDLVEWLRQFGYSHQKYVPRIILDSSREQIRIFLDAFALGDGTPRKKKNMFGFEADCGQYYYTSSKKMADTLAECIIKVGSSPSVKFERRKGNLVRFRNGEYEIKTNIYIINEKKSQYMQLRTAKAEIKEYNDFLYDIEVDRNNTLLVKYNSCVHWNGNCKCVMRAIIELEGV